VFCQNNIQKAKHTQFQVKMSSTETKYETIAEEEETTVVDRASVLHSDRVFADEVAAQITIPDGCCKNKTSVKEDNANNTEHKILDDQIPNLEKYIGFSFLQPIGPAPRSRAHLHSSSNYNSFVSEKATNKPVPSTASSASASHDATQSPSVESYYNATHDNDDTKQQQQQPYETPPLNSFGMIFQSLIMGSVTLSINEIITYCLFAGIVLLLLILLYPSMLMVVLLTVLVIGLLVMRILLLVAKKSCVPSEGGQRVKTTTTKQSITNAMFANFDPQRLRLLREKYKKQHST
jgi:hypothetical protein